MNRLLVWCMDVSRTASRYLLSGGLVYAIDLACFTGLMQLAPSGYAVWTAAGRLAGAIAGYFLHNHFSFAGEKAVSQNGRIARYVALLCINMTASVLLLEIAVRYFHFMTWVSRIVIDVALIAASFFISRHFIFKGKQA